MPTDKPQQHELKVTDKRIFTPEGEIREEFRDEIKPADPNIRAAEPAAAATENPAPKPNDAQPSPTASRPVEPAANPRSRPVAEQGENPGTPFSNFIEQLIAQGYMSLGMLRDPRMPQVKIDAAAARQMIDILSLLQTKTAGNLTPEEEDFLHTHLGELKLAFVQRTKSI